MKAKPGRDHGRVAIELGTNEPALPGTADSTPSAPMIFKLKRILVPVDFTEGSHRALQYAVAFARQFDAELTLLNVVPRYPQVPEMAPLALQPAEDVKKLMEELVNTLEWGVSATTQVRTGEPGAEIIAAARELEADLIILSTHGRTGLSHFLLGSTAAKVARRAGCPVLVVRNHEHEFIIDGSAMEAAAERNS